MIGNKKKNKKKITKKQVVLIAFLIGLIVVISLAFGLYAKGKEVDTIKEKIEVLEQRNEVLEKENKEMHDLVIYNISEGVPLKKKIAFLTFDDGPSDLTMGLLGILKEAGVKANFFLLGHKIDAYPDATKAIADAGHGVFVHSDTHQYTDIYSSKDALINDFMATSKKITKLGIKEPKIYRFPGGSTNSYVSDAVFAEIQEALKKEKINYIDWNVDSGDARRNNVPAEEIKNNILREAGSRNTINVLLHDTNAKETTINAMPAVIAGLKEMGYIFWVIPEGVSGPAFR